MAIAPGTLLGSYEILALIGAGGMGEVYRARDTKLARDVAIKVLPDTFDHDPDRLARFKREARVLASLNHPNIAAIYGLEESNGVHALVLELVEGSTLADVIGRQCGADGGSSPQATPQSGSDARQAVGTSPHRVPLDDALSIARQIVEALEAAHEKGIVHRDLKPANVTITPAGVVKVLDFGLAKTDIAAPALDVTNEQTLSILPDRLGMLLGTVPYMSPEQARGYGVDKRTDIWAFGCVLYEMLTGRRAFHELTPFDTIAAILGRPPDWSALAETMPAGVRRVLERCLEKDPRRRLRDIGDARLDLEAAVGDTAAVVSGSGHTSQPDDIEFKRLTDFVGMKETPAMSPDGKMIAFVAFVAGRRQIWIRMLAGGASLQLTRDPVDHEHPRWAPDSSTLIYYTPPAKHGGDGTIWEISALGGWPHKVAQAISGGDISHDGRRIALFQVAEDRAALVTMARDGSGAAAITCLPQGQGYAAPRWSPDDRSIAFQYSSDFGVNVSIDIMSIGDGARRSICHDHWLKGFCWLADGSGIVYSSSRGSTLLYPPVFNLRTVTVDGRADRQLTFGDQSYVEPDTQRPGRLVASRIKSASDIWKIPVGGSPADNTHGAIRVTEQTGQVRTPSPSPDDTEVVYLSDTGGHGNLWVAKTDGSGARQITFEQDSLVSMGVPKWSPAGDLIAFVMARDEEVGLSIIHPDGSGLRRIAAVARGPCWSGDGQWLYYESAADRFALWKMRPDGSQSVAVRSETDGSVPAISADGTTLYYVASPRRNALGLVSVRTAKEIRRARPEDGPSETLACIPGNRISGLPPVLYVVVSPDGHGLAIPLADGATTNLWLLPTAGGAMTPITDFGDRAIEIARSISWSADGRHLYAAVAEIETDIVLLGGLIP